ncbi:MAG TPA: response regulator, partial [Herpetosiphonaceae bacterium]
MATILILEDDPSICQLLSRVCAAHGHTVVTAADGLAGARQIISAHPDLVISDINLPLRSGPDVVAGVLPSQIPVLFISGNGQSSVSVNGRTHPVIA